MKEYSLLIGDQVSGPFPESEIEAKIKSGEISADTLIAEPGATEWTPAKELIKIRSVRLSRKTEEEERKLREAKEEKLDPILRKKLLRYNLADAISVDKFSPEQAKAAVDYYEKEQAKGKYVKIGVGIGGFILTFGAVFLLLSEVKLEGVHRTLLAPVMEAFIEPNPEYKKLEKDTERDVLAINELREQVMALEFKLPKGNNPRTDFINRVVIVPEKANFVAGKINPSMLFSAILPEGTKTLPEVKIFIKRERPSSSIKNTIQREIELLALLKKPLWTDEELRAKVAAELEPLFPRKAEVSHSEYFAEMLRNVKCSTIESETQNWISRLEGLLNVQDSKARYYVPVERQRLKTRNPDKKLLNELNSSKTKKAIEELPKDSPAKAAVVAWCVRDMPPFLDKLQEFIDANKIYYSAGARTKAWNDFLAENKETLEKEFAEAAKETYPVAADGTYRIPGRDDTRFNFLVTNGNVNLYIPDMEIKTADGAGKAIALENRERINIKPEDVLMSEKYAVAKKMTAGNIPYYTTGKILRRKINIIRNSPELYFIEVTRLGNNDSRKRSPMILRVPDKETFDKLAVGTEIPMETLLTYEKFSQPKAPTPPSKLAILPKDEESESKK